MVPFLTTMNRGNLQLKENYSALAFEMQINGRPAQTLQIYTTHSVQLFCSLSIIKPAVRTEYEYITDD